MSQILDDKMVQMRITDLEYKFDNMTEVFDKIFLHSGEINTKNG